MDTETILKQFHSFCTKVGGEFSDFQIVEDGEKWLKRLVPATAVPFFQVIGRQKNGSLICFWQHQENLSLTKQPVVWLDSEGSPQAVFAPDFPTFLTLLPYDTGGIYDMLAAWERFLDPDEEGASPKKRFTKGKFNMYVEMSQKNYPKYDRFIEWLAEMNIAVAKNPVNVIGKAVQESPKLKEWLTKQ